MDKRGYIKLYRKMQENFLWKERREFSKAEAWIDILWEIQHDPEPQNVQLGWKVVQVNQGQTIKSLETWAKRWNWSKSRVWRFLKLLHSQSMIRYENETKTIRITVLNYWKYAGQRNENETKVKRKRNGSETEVKPDKNDKNVKNNKDTGDYPDDFEKWWQEYPKKKAKKAAFKAWQNAKDKPGLDKLVKAVQIQRKSRDWNKENGRYIPHPATWLNQGRWEDVQEQSAGQAEPASGNWGEEKNCDWLLNLGSEGKIPQ